MKKILSTVLIATSIVFSAAAVTAGVSAKESGKRTQDAVSAIIKKYSNESGVESMNLGKMALSALRTVMRLSSDKDARAMLELSKDVHGMSVMEYDDCSAKVRKQVSSELQTALAGVEMLMELHDDDDTVRIYGTVSPDGKSVTDTVIFMPEDCVLICFYGTVAVDALQNTVDL